MPTNAELFNRAMQYHQQGRLAQAEPLYRQVLKADPAHADALHFLGILANQTGRPEVGIPLLRQAVSLHPSNPVFHTNLGLALDKQRHHAEAAACFRQALQLDDRYMNAHYNLGIALYKQGHLAEAGASFQQALQVNPRDANAHYNLGNIFWKQGLPADAEKSFRQALQINPNLVDAHHDLGNAIKEQGRYPEAAQCYRQAMQLNPNHADAYYNLGMLLVEQGELADAVKLIQKALELKPQDPATLGQYIYLLQQLGIWQNIMELSGQMLETLGKDAPTEDAGAVQPATFLTLPLPTTPAQQLRFASKLAQGRPDKTKITLGYLSTDFRKHAVAYLIAELFELHDRRRFEVIGYSLGPDDGSSLRQRLVRSFDRFVDLQGQSFLDSAERIAADGVDILIDLNGYTGKHRVPILAHRPAPIQVNYLGYPGTMGAPFMDYILVDEFIVPAHLQPFYTEQLVHLPCYQVNDRKREISARTPTRSECGLPDQGLVFCDFNNTFKITPKMFAVWMEVLKAVPGSVLWLWEGNRFVPSNLREEAKGHGVAPERLVFAGNLPLPDHLARYRLADLFLDTFPYGALTTASDALWAGCPLLTLVGDTFISRVGGSLLKTIGLPELLTTTFEEYQALAIQLGRDPALLAGLRSRLAANRETSILFNAVQFTRNLEKAYEKMWAMHRAGEKPRAFAVNYENSAT